MSNIKYRKPNSINWLFSFSDAKNIVRHIRAYNLDSIEAVSLIDSKTEDLYDTYDVNKRYNQDGLNNKELIQDIIDWMNKLKSQFDNVYVYYRFKKS